MSHRLELIQENDELHQIRFTAMASPCQVLLDHIDWMSAAHIAQAVYAECLRIEHKYSRYRDDSFLASILLTRLFSTNPQLSLYFLCASQSLFPSAPTNTFLILYSKCGVITLIIRYCPPRVSS